MEANDFAKNGQWWLDRLGTLKASRSECAASPAKIIVVAGSMGAIPVIIGMLKSLPADNPFPILICQHRADVLPNMLPDLLGRNSKLRVKLAEAGESLAAGTAYIAPAHSHLIVDDNGLLGFIDGRKVKFLKSAAEPLFASVAATFGSRVVPIVLTGYGSDAALGVQDVKQRGGSVIVEDQSTCAAAEMPAAAIRTGCVDQVLSVAEINKELLALADDRECDVE